MAPRTRRRLAEQHVTEKLKATTTTTTTTTTGGARALGDAEAKNPFLDPEFRRKFAETHRHGFTPLNETTVEAAASSRSATVTLGTKTASTKDAIDWRDEGIISDVKYQGSCGTCWAFVTTGLIEARYALDYGTLISLSEQQVMDCSRNDINQACSGGNQYTAIVGWNGNFYTEAAYPYVLSSSGQSEHATDAEDDYYCADTYTRQGVFALNESASIVRVSPRTEDALLAALQYGPVAVAAAGYNDVFLGYTGGILDSEACDSDAVVDHALLVVGYGSEDGVDYYIAKNSWGPAWGEDGYVRLARNVDTDARPYGACNILFQADYLEPYAVSCSLSYNAPCSTYASAQFCTVENGCQSSAFFAENYEFDASAITGAGSSGNKDAIYIGVSVTMGLLIIVGVFLFVRKMRREDEEERMAASKLAAFTHGLRRRSTSSASTSASKKAAARRGLGYLGNEVDDEDDQEDARRRKRFSRQLPELRRRLLAVPAFRLSNVASQDSLLLSYLEEHRGNVDSAFHDFLDRES